MNFPTSREFLGVRSCWRAGRRPQSHPQRSGTTRPFTPIWAGPLMQREGNKMTQRLRNPGRVWREATHWHKCGSWKAQTAGCSRLDSRPGPAPAAGQPQLAVRCSACWPWPWGKPTDLHCNLKWLTLTQQLLDDRGHLPAGHPSGTRDKVPTRGSCPRPPHRPL